MRPRRSNIFRMSNGMSCVRYHRTVITNLWNNTTDLGGEFDHATTLLNEDGFTRMSVLWRKFKILSASCSFMPANNLANQTNALVHAGPVFIAPYYGDFAGTVLSYSRLANIPGCVMVNPCDTSSNYKRAYWKTKREFEDCEVANLAGRSLDASYGGFLVYCDGTGQTVGGVAGHTVITFKVRYSDPRNIS